MNAAMYFESFSELWSMAGHGPYVWTAYAIVLAVIVLLVRAPLVRRRRLLERVRRRAALASGAPAGGSA